MTAKPPFRADHVGSLLRPERLKQAREKFLGPQTADQNIGPHDSADLRAVEDECVREAVAMQESVGLRAATDGEFRRRSWWLELIMNWEGFAATRQGRSPFAWRNEHGKQQDFSALWVTGPIRWRPSPIVRAFEFLKANTRLVPKVTIPGPQMVHCFMGGDPAVLSSPAYDDVEVFWEDLVGAYRQEVQALVAAGAKYIQLDDTSIVFLCDPSLRQVVQGWGQDPEELLGEYARRINQVLDGLPEDVTVTMHQCRGNREGMWAAEGGYDFVADVMFNRIDVDGYFLEYDTERAGGFEPLRFLPAGKTVALGLVCTKTPALEDPDALERRIDEASRFAPLDRLTLTTQCGFASSVGGNPLSEAEEAAKLARIVEVAREVWGDA